LLFCFSVLAVPTIPTVVTADLKVTVASGFFSFSLQGRFWMDYPNRGVRGSLSGPNPFTPGTTLNLTGVVSPDALRATANIWLVQNGNCTSVAQGVPVALLPPLAIPSDAQSLGTEVINGQTCTGWKVTLPVPDAPLVDLYVSTQSPFNIYRLKATVVQDGVTVVITADFSNHNNGPIPTTIFGQPPSCKTL